MELIRIRTGVPDPWRGDDAFVSQTRYEAYALAVHKAVCCGLPAIVSRGAGIAQRCPPQVAHLPLPEVDDGNALATWTQRWRHDTFGRQPRIRPFRDRLRARSSHQVDGAFLATIGEVS